MFKPYHLWEELRVGEQIVVLLPIIDLVPVVERLSREKGMVFQLKKIKVEEGPVKTAVLRRK